MDAGATPGGAQDERATIAALQSSTHRFTVAWTLALVAVALIAITGWMLVDSTLVLQREAATVTRVVAEQREHVDTLQDVARSVGRADDALTARRAVAEVPGTLERFEGVHQLLVSGDPATGLAAPIRAEMRASTSSLDRHGPELTDSLAALVAAVEALEPAAQGPGVAESLADEVAAVDRADERYQRSLGELASEYDQLAAAQVEEARGIDRSMLIATLILLAIEAVLVFRPVTRRMREAAERRQRASEEERRHAAAQLEQLARHDHLTGLANRMAFRDRLDHATATAERTGKRLAVMFLDLDKFKEINDSYGHDAGDELLVRVAERLQAVARRGDTIARFGGDEFVVLLESLEGPDGAAAAAAKVLEAMSEPFELAGRHLTITTSIGVSLYPDDALVADDLLRFADSAMYQAKGAGRDTFQFSTPELRAVSVRRARLISELRSAVAMQRLRLAYQPQVSVTTGELVGVEAFVRWIRPDGTEVRAGDFIEVLEDTDLMTPLGAWVLEEACRQNMAWQAEGVHEITMAINLSGQQFRQLGLSSTVAAALEQSGMPADLLEIELTERSLVQDPDSSASTLQLLKALGVRIAIDDFGTGYSSLTYLKTFPIDVLKIDGSFVHRLDRDGDDARAVPGAIAGLARHLGMGTTAEGVESAEQLTVLRDLGCDRAQGYYIGRPLDPGEVPAFARQAGLRAGSPTPQRSPSPSTASERV